MHERSPSLLRQPRLTLRIDGRISPPVGAEKTREGKFTQIFRFFPACCLLRLRKIPLFSLFSAKNSAINPRCHVWGTENPSTDGPFGAAASRRPEVTSRTQQHDVLDSDAMFTPPPALSIARGASPAFCGVRFPPAAPQLFGALRQLACTSTRFAPNNCGAWVSTPSAALCLHTLRVAATTAGRGSPSVARTRRPTAAIRGRGGFTVTVSKVSPRPHRVQLLLPFRRGEAVGNRPHAPRHPLFPLLCCSGMAAPPPCGNIRGNLANYSRSAGGDPT